MSTDAGDGRHVPVSLYSTDGGFVQRGKNDALVEVAPGTEGQVPTYQADGTLLASDASGGASFDFVADVTPGSASPTRTGLQDFDGVTGVDGLIVFVYGGGGSNRINSGLWQMNSGAWTRPTGWTTSTDITGYSVSVKSGTLYGGTKWSLARGSVLGTDQQFWDAVVRGPGNVNPPTDIGGVLTALGTRNEYTELPHPGVAGKVLTSNASGVQPSWETPGGGGGATPQFTHLLDLTAPSPLTLTGGSDTIEWNTFNGYNFQTDDVEANASASYNWNDAEEVILQPGLYHYVFKCSLSSVDTTAWIQAQINGIGPSAELLFPTINGTGSGYGRVSGIFEFKIATSVTVTIAGTGTPDLSDATLSFFQLESP